MSVHSELWEISARRLVGWFGVLVASCGGAATGGDIGAGGGPGVDAGPFSDSGSSALPAFAVVTNRYDNDRTGANTHETILNTSNVAAPDKFGLLFSRLYEGNAYAQPLYVGGLAIARRQAQRGVRRHFDEPGLRLRRRRSVGHDPLLVKQSRRSATSPSGAAMTA